MRDTSPEIEKQFISMMMKRSGQERLKMGFSMFNLARKQALASIRRNKPTASEEEIRKELFFRFYGNEFSPEDQKKILRQIRSLRKE
ncbi:MAG: hypothetical protein QME90_06625 [Thermodesulfobacteriota bacterium]|nr:hypothetical protein [Thermodesulfobacteriota bacterium]